VGSGPSLRKTETELRDLVFAGAKLVTVNGAYAWCIERNLQPNAQIVIDARASNSRFLEPAVPNCRYYLASQCHPALFDAVDGREFVGIFHVLGDEGPIKDELDRYFLGKWAGVIGGSTVTTRALGLLRMLGYLRFDLFGIDSCWDGDAHHAFDQPENARDHRLRVTVSAVDNPAQRREFLCAPWHVQQAEDFMQVLRLNGQHFLMNVHGDGLIAYLLRTAADLDLSITPEFPSSGPHSARHEEGA